MVDLLCVDSFELQTCLGDFDLSRQICLYGVFSFKSSHMISSEDYEQGNELINEDFHTIIFENSQFWLKQLIGLIVSN